MGKVRKSPRLSLLPLNGLAKNDTLVVIKNRNPQKKPAEKRAVSKVAIEYICDKCSKKYTTKLGVIKHIKFCIDTSSINRKILNGRRKIITTLSDGRRKKSTLSNGRINNNIALLNRKTQNGISNGRIKNTTNLLNNHDLISQSLNFLLKPLSDKESSDLSNNNISKSGNLFELGENSSDPSFEEEYFSLPAKTPDLSGSCGGNAATAHKV